MSRNKKRKRKEFSPSSEITDGQFVNKEIKGLTIRKRYYVHPKGPGYYFVYVLKLEQGKYYIGISRNVNKRIDNHCIGEGAAWTKKYAPIRIISVDPLPCNKKKEAEEYEDERTQRLIRRFGKNNVRGGSYVAVDQEKLNAIIDKKPIKTWDYKKNKPKHHIKVNVKKKFPIGSHVEHETFGRGKVSSIENQNVKVFFDEYGYKLLNADTCIEMGLMRRV